MIEAVFKDGKHLGIDLRYVREEEPLGTAGALNLLRDKLHGPFLMMNGGLVTRLDFRKLFTYHQECGAEITVATKRYEVRVPYGIVDDEGGRVTRLREKPTYATQINAGIYIVSPIALDLLPATGRYRRRTPGLQLCDPGVLAGYGRYEGLRTG